MDRLCNTCANYDKKYDEFRHKYYDTIIEFDKRQRHGCIMYEDQIPQKIWYENANCPYYIEKEAEDGTGNKRIINGSF